jgi:hypothetical protein
VQPTTTLPPERSTCRYCGHSIEGDWLFCPACGSDRSGRPPAPDEDYPDPQVRRDQRGTGWGLGMLAFLGSVGLFFTLAAGSEAGGGVFTIILLVLLMVVAGTAAWTYSRPNPPQGAAGIGRVAVGTLQVLGMLFAGLFLLLLTVWGFFFLACLAGAIR